MKNRLVAVLDVWLPRLLVLYSLGSMTAAGSALVLSGLAALILAAVAQVGWPILAPVALGLLLLLWPAINAVSHTHRRATCAKAPVTKPSRGPHHPLFAASSNSHITATDTRITGTPDFVLASAEGGSRIDVYDTRIFADPPSAPVASSKTNSELADQVRGVMLALRELERQVEADLPDPPRPAATAGDRQLERDWHQRRSISKERFEELTRRNRAGRWDQRLAAVHGDLAARGYAEPWHPGRFDLPHIHRDCVVLETALRRMSGLD